MSNSKFLEQYLQQITNRFQQEQFDAGRVDGQCGNNNNNVGLLHLVLIIMLVMFAECMNDF